MTEAPPITIVNVGYRSTNYWVVSAGSSRMLVDLGWPGTMGRLRASMRRQDVPWHELRYALATHYHPDHAGLAQEIKEAGVPLLVLEAQVDAIPLMARWTKPADNYVEILPEGNAVVSFAQSRSVLTRAGIPGEIVHTPGHSDDSVSLVLDNGAAFTGDLTHPALATPEDLATVTASWQLLAERGARRIYPGHGPVRAHRTGQ